MKVDSQIIDNWKGIQLPVTFNSDTGEICCDMGIRMLEVLTPAGRPNLVLGPIVAAAINSRDSALSAGATISGKSGEQREADVVRVSREMRGKTFGNLTAMADTFRRLEECGWVELDFHSFYPKNTVEEAIRQGWKPAIKS